MLQPARKPPTLFQKMQLQQPWCVFCGGETEGTSADHVPPKTVFDYKLRPKGLEFMQCDDCRQGTRRIDQVAGLMARMYSARPGNRESRLELRRIIEGVANNAPDVLRELRLESTLSTRDTARSVLSDAVAVFSVGPVVRSYLNAFGARLALAFHYKATGRILPKTGGIFARWQSNQSILDNEVPEDLLALLGEPRTLEQGRRSVADQFFYQSRSDNDGKRTAHFVGFRVSFAVTAFAFEDFKEMRDAWGRVENLFIPGFLKNY